MSQLACRTSMHGLRNVKKLCWVRSAAIDSKGYMWSWFETSRLYVSDIQNLPCYFQLH